MPDSAVVVQNLSKLYRLGLKQQKHDTLVGAMTSWLRAPFQNLQNLRRLDVSRHNGEDAADILWALRDVSFEVKEGESIGIIGRNGAGKSTLLKILSRITEPTKGRITIRGRVSSLLEVGTGFHPELTGRENIYMNGTILGMTKREIDGKFDEIVDFSGVERFIDTPVKRYSSGMTVRLAFAVAAHLDPEILIIDEVLAVGDAEFQKKCLGKMQDVAGQGRTVLFVSHNMIAVRQLCSRGILIETGHVVADDSAEQAIARYTQTAGAGTHTQADYPDDPIKKMQVRRVAVKDTSGNLVASPHELNSDVVIEIEYMVRARVHAPYFACFFKNQEDTVVLFLDDRDGLAPLPRTLGTHIVNIRLPGGVLNSGDYSIHIGIRDGSEQLEQTHGEATFSLNDLKTGRPYARPGFSALKLPWEIVR